MLYLHRGLFYNQITQILTFDAVSADIVATSGHSQIQHIIGQCYFSTEQLQYYLGSPFPDILDNQWSVCQVFSVCRAPF